MFEINLVPDLKVAVLKTQRIRNIIFIVCVFVMIAMGVVVTTLGSIKAVQDGTLAGQGRQLKLMSEKITNYSDLNNFLTVQNQLNKLGEIEEVKVDYSRIFDLISILPPTNGDEITYYEMTINLVQHTINFGANADAHVEPEIDYRVLETFKKSMEYMKYDYGVYVNENGFEIPSVCILETDEEGNALFAEKEFDEDGRVKTYGGFYAIWTKGVSGCDPEDEGKMEVIEDEDGVEREELKKTEVVDITEESVEEARDSEDSVRIWRTPQFNEWYKGEGKKNVINGGGEISGIEHFESQCIRYELIGGRWASSNDCNLIVGDLNISESSNGKMDDSGSLVLKFSASLTYNPEALYYKNKHMAFIAPSGYMNVTDSNLQIQNLFEKEAIDCKEGDVDCANVDPGGDLE